MGQRRLRVAHVVLQLNTGGMEKLLVEFARHADRGAVEPCFVSLGGRGPLAEDLEAQGWRVFALGEPPGLRPRLVWRLAQLFRNLAADVVHTHNTKPLIYAGPAARWAGVGALIHTRHGQRFGAGRGANVLFRLAAGLTDCFVAVSHDGARLSAREGIARKKIQTIWNGVDGRRFPYAGPVPGGPAVMVGRLSPEKDVATLLRASDLAARADPGFRLEIAGDGPCRDALHRLTEELGLGDRVRFLGEVRDVAGLLARAGLFVLPSLTEGISLTVLEAMGRGLPVVATRVGGNPEVVVEGQTGLLVPARDPAHLARAMLHLRRDPDLSRRMGQAGHRRVGESFDIRRMVRDYERLYAEVLGGYAKADSLPRAGGTTAARTDRRPPHVAFLHAGSGEE